MAIITKKIHKKNDGGIVWISIDEVPPIIKDTSVVDGGFFIRISDDKGDKVIRLSDQEAIDIAHRIIEAYKRHINEYPRLSQKAYEEYKRKNQNPSESEDIDNEDF
ncbi:hypothetical protein [Stygiolobus caldivivus]|uniref:Uncharacterized protein n=1 Tax=Stygiolobus caldivivus TaxID=2824673 RepID=A0A8D5U7L2_9CREN|nr:hypothetical protein [Stygiolobus caldivivus]BCU71051.1 hypothetical protein KN1_23480 [Stygiolobus caldivivus]